jgi:sugar lactone lactonase YvrE
LSIWVIQGIIDIDFDGDGNLYVLEISASLLTEDPAGALIRVDFNDVGSREVIASDGLTMPASVAVGPDGKLYVSNCGICPSTGEVVRIEP